MNRSSHHVSPHGLHSLGVSSQPRRVGSESLKGISDIEPIPAYRREVLQNRASEAFTEPSRKDYAPPVRKTLDAGAVVLLWFKDDRDSGLQVPVQELRDALGLRGRSRASSLGEQLLDRLLKLLCVRHVLPFKRRRERDRDIWRADPHKRSLQVVNRLLEDGRADFRPHTPGLHIV